MLRRGYIATTLLPAMLLMTGWSVAVLLASPLIAIFKLADARGREQERSVRVS